MSHPDIDLAREEHRARSVGMRENRHATRAVAAARLQRRAARLSARAARVSRRADRAASRARLTLARAL